MNIKHRTVKGTLIAMYNHQLWLIVKTARPSIPWEVLKKPMPKILLTREAGRKRIDRIWMTRSARLSSWEARAICVDSVAILMLTLKLILVKRYPVGPVFTNLCVSLVDHCKAFTDTNFGSLVIEINIGANKLCFSHERVERLPELRAQLYFIMHRENAFFKPLVLSL